MGGSIEYINNNGIINNCEFIENRADNAGGAIDFDGTGAIKNSNFVGNVTAERSAIYNSGKLELDNNTIETEYAEIYNDCLIVSPTTLTVLNNETVIGFLIKILKLHHFSG